MLSKSRHERAVQDPHLARLIKEKSRQLARTGLLQGADAEDVSQQLWTHLLSRLQYFNPQFGHLRVYATVVVERHTATIFSAAKAQKRGSGRRPLSLDQPLSDRKGYRFDGVLSITKEEQDNRKGRRSLSSEELIDLSYDLAAVMRELPPDLLEVANRLKRQSAAEAAREMGIPRSTFYELI